VNRPGYEGGLHFANVRGEAGRPIVIAAADPEIPPLFKGGANGIQLSDVEHVELHDLSFTGCTANGVNVDDGGTFDTPAHHVVLRGLRISKIGAGGNQDGIKLSGVDDFRVEGCFWYCVDAPARSRPKLPADEKGGAYGTDPGFRDAGKGDLRLRAESPARAYGAEALK